jgi:hypothetical protein
MIRTMQIVVGMATLSFALAAEAQRPIVYPAKGQSGANRVRTTPSVLRGRSKPRASIRRS